MSKLWGPSGQDNEVIYSSKYITAMHVVIARAYSLPEWRRSLILGIDWGVSFLNMGLFGSGCDVRGVSCMFEKWNCLYERLFVRVRSARTNFVYFECAEADIRHSCNVMCVVEYPFGFVYVLIAFLLVLFRMIVFFLVWKHSTENNTPTRTQLQIFILNFYMRSEKDLAYKLYRRRTR